MREEWREVAGYEGMYMISSCGNLKSLNRIDSNGRRRNGQDFKPRIRGGYFTYGISKGCKSKTYQAHRLVAIAFIANPLNKPQVNHKDGNKLNNDISNLEWVTGSENLLHSYDIGIRKRVHPYQPKLPIRRDIRNNDKEIDIIIDKIQSTKHLLKRGGLTRVAQNLGFGYSKLSYLHSGRTRDKYGLVLVFKEIRNELRRQRLSPVEVQA